ncbi:hypothetical protein BU15DRAFT_64272 [Melanogaster broomeanus]|nr:hypothetical protein BU15DRAFT_64272 [Melanogaster broomeanus]
MALGAKPPPAAAASFNSFVAKPQRVKASHNSNGRGVGGGTWALRLEHKFQLLCFSLSCCPCLFFPLHLIPLDFSLCILPVHSQSCSNSIYSPKISTIYSFLSEGISKISKIKIEETPLTSPERAQRAARHAERERRDLGSPPMCRQPYRTVTVPENPLPALMLHPPVPLNRFPGMPRNIIERHEVQRTWRAQHPPPPPPPHGYAPEWPPGPMQSHGSVPVLQPMHPYGFAPMVPPMMPPMQLQGLAPPPPPMQVPPVAQAMHGDIFYEGAAQPRQQGDVNIHHFPQQQHVRGVGARVDYTAAVMQATEHAHAERRRNRRRRNAAPAPAPAAPIPALAEPDYNHFNVGFQHRLKNSSGSNCNGRQSRLRGRLLSDCRQSWLKDMQLSNSGKWS